MTVVPDICEHARDQFSGVHDGFTYSTTRSINLSDVLLPFSPISLLDSIKVCQCNSCHPLIESLPRRSQS